MFYDKVRAYKEKHKIKTDYEFEELCGLKHSTLCYYKNGGKPTLATIERVAEKTKTKVGYWI